MSEEFTKLEINDPAVQSRAMRIHQDEGIGWFHELKRTKRRHYLLRARKQLHDEQKERIKNGRN